MMKKRALSLRKMKRPTLTPSRVLRGKNMLKCIARDMSDPFYQNVAPGLAYYFLLSIAPIVLSFSFFASFFFTDSTYITRLLHEYLPEEAIEVLLPFLAPRSSTAGLLAATVFFVLTLYLASRGVYALSKVADYSAGTLAVAELKEVPLAFIKRHLKAVALTFMLIVAIVVALVFIVFGKAVLDLWLVHIKTALLVRIVLKLYKVMIYPIVIAVIFLLISVFYSRMPLHRLPLKSVFPGAALATIGIVLASTGYLLYIKYFFRNNVIYGALSSVIILILWFFLLAYLLVFGIIFNAAVHDTRPENR